MVAALFEEAEAQSALHRMAGHSLHAPHLLVFEFANVARSKRRAGAPQPKVDEALRAFAELRIEWHAVAAAELHALALERALTAYDAAYLCLAARLKAPLGTFDRRLSEAAQRHLGTME